MADVALL